MEHFWDENCWNPRFIRIFLDKMLLGGGLLAATAEPISCLY